MDSVHNSYNMDVDKVEDWEHNLVHKHEHNIVDYDNNQVVDSFTVQMFFHVIDNNEKQSMVDY